jgi:hypothetical protein
MPFKSGGGNINDGWHGSQKYVKILPRDFVIDDDDMHGTTGAADYTGAGTVTGSDYEPHTHDRSSHGTVQANSIIHQDASTFAKIYAPSKFTGAAQFSNGAVHPGSLTGGYSGMGAFIPIPLGYWAIACKIYSAFTWKYGWNSNIPKYNDDYTDNLGSSLAGTDYGVTAVHDSAGIQAHECSLIDGGSSTLLASLGSTNVREVFDTAMLGQEQNYCYIAVNGIPTDNVIYGGYIELRRVKTAEAIAEEESETGGDVLIRVAGG